MILQYFCLRLIMSTRTVFPPSIICYRAILYPSIILALVASLCNALLEHFGVTRTHSLSW